MYNSPCGKVGKVARASAAARGVSFIFGRFFGHKLENPDLSLCGFRQQDDVSDFCSIVFWSCFLVTFFSNLSQIPCFFVLYL